MTRLLEREHYNELTVAQIIALAGVSRPTFYEHFTGREAALLAVLAPIREQLLRRARTTVRGLPPGRCASGVIEAIVQFASSEPVLARIAISETLSAGRGALDERDELIGSLASIIEESYRQAPPATLAPDVPSIVLTGAVSRMLAAGLSHCQPPGDELSRQLTAWLQSYQVPLAEHRWRSLRAVSDPAPSPFLAPGPLRAPADRVSGRHALQPSRTIERQRLRLIFATAEIVHRDGYDAASVAAIARHAGLDPRVFYRLFADKREAFTACSELLFGHLMAVTAGAFASGATWPERVWEAARVFAQCLTQNATLASVALMDAHSTGVHAPRRAQRTAGAFTIFLEEGLREHPPSGVPVEVCLDALTASIFELSYQLVRREQPPPFCGVLPHALFLTLAPFLGAGQTNALLDRQMAGAGDRARTPPSPSEHAVPTFAPGPG